MSACILVYIYEVILIILCKFITLLIIIVVHPKSKFYSLGDIVVSEHQKLSKLYNRSIRYIKIIWFHSSFTKKGTLQYKINFDHSVKFDQTISPKYSHDYSHDIDMDKRTTAILTAIKVWTIFNLFPARFWYFDIDKYFTCNMQ